MNIEIWVMHIYNEMTVVSLFLPFFFLLVKLSLLQPLLLLQLNEQPLHLGSNSMLLAYKSWPQSLARKMFSVFMCVVSESTE
jgi:hypothetical protein